MHKQIYECMYSLVSAVLSAPISDTEQMEFLFIEHVSTAPVSDTPNRSNESFSVVEF